MPVAPLGTTHPQRTRKQAAISAARGNTPRPKRPHVRVALRENFRPQRPHQVALIVALGRTPSLQARSRVRSAHREHLLAQGQLHRQCARSFFHLEPRRALRHARQTARRPVGSSCAPRAMLRTVRLIACARHYGAGWDTPIRPLKAPGCASGTGRSRPTSTGTRASLT